MLCQVPDLKQQVNADIGERAGKTKKAAAINLQRLLKYFFREST
jgi:hypothetical protein